MTEARKSPYAPRVISEGDIPVHKSLGEVAQTCRVGVPRPMPGIVILVQGQHYPGRLVRANSTKGNEGTGAEYAETGGGVSSGR